MNAVGCPTQKTAIAAAHPEYNSVGAVIDIGSNSVKLLVGLVTGTAVERIYSSGETLKLGRGAFLTRWLMPESIERVAGMVAKFAEVAGKFCPSVFRILATSAVREALNGLDLVRAVEVRTGKRVEILSGVEEAQLLFEGVRGEPGLAGSALMVVDVGGGSTQMVASDNGARALYFSFSFGSLRLLETLGLSGRLSGKDLTTCRNSAANFVLHQVIPAIGQTRFDGRPFNTMRLVATGRKLRLLARLANSRANADESESLLPVSSNGLTAAIERLWGMTPQRRADVLGVSDEAADVVLTAAVTLEAISQRFHFDLLHASHQSLRHGAILTSFARRGRTRISKPLN
jgi:exopolyphosphatase/guanosine-5'-triphosphate,3'-diphosphate pyrophosphatase